MFSYLKKVLKYMKFVKTAKRENEKADSAPRGAAARPSISEDIRENVAAVRKIFNDSCDIKIREFSFGQKNPVQAAIIYVDGLTEKSMVNQSIIKPLMYDSRLCFTGEFYKDDIDSIESMLLSVGDVEKVSTMEEVVSSCTTGDTIGCPTDFPHRRFHSGKPFLHCPVRKELQG